MTEDLYLGQVVDASGEVTPEHLVYEADDLTTHGVIVGMTGSGKTGLAVVMLEELLSKGIPALILDPKGDMANLLLNFPDADPVAFEPWVNDGDARSRGVPTAEFAKEQATLWQKGLEGAGVSSERMRALRDGVAWTVYTPGSTAGTALNVIGDLAAPPAGSDVEGMREALAPYRDATGIYQCPFASWVVSGTR
jgi:DNA helicase HerA-like ATPase